MQKLHVRRFRSLYDVDLAFSQFSVLTGPNGSGKTNAVDAIAFLGEVYSFGIEYAVGRAGGIDAIAFRDKRRTTIGVEFEVEAVLRMDEVRAARLSPDDRIRVRDQEFVVKHVFTLKPAGAESADYAVSTEILSVQLVVSSGNVPLASAVSSPEPEGSPTLTIHDLSAAGLDDEQQRSATALIGNGARLAGDTYGVARAGASMLEILRLIPAIREYQDRMSYIRAYRLNPAGCRQAGVLTPNATLEGNGGNLPAVVARMKRREKGLWESVMASMRVLLPSLTSIDAVPSAEHGLVLTFQEAGRGRPWSAHEVSDGTIQALAMFAALLDQRAPIVVLEEPENTVHPWVLRRFVEQIRDLERKQVVLTTHSPVLLKLVRPEEVYLLWRINGRSKVKSLTKALPDAPRLYYEQGFDVFELYDSGLITEAIPGISLTQ